MLERVGLPKATRSFSNMQDGNTPVHSRNDINDIVGMIKDVISCMHALGVQKGF
jgi:hypothetical protein